MGIFKRSVHEATALVASAERTSDGNGDVVRLQSMVNAFAFTLDVTAAQTDATDTLDVYVQTKIDDVDGTGTNWVDVVHFTQCTGSGGAVRHIAKLSAGLANTMFSAATALTAGNVRHILGDEWRVRWDLTEGPGGASGSGTGTAAFTFSVTACPM